MQKNYPKSAPPQYFQGLAEVPLVQILFEVYRKWHGCIIKFPKSERYGLGQATSITILALLERVIEAVHQFDRAVKANCLEQASTKLDLLRLQLRLAKECGCLENKEYLDLGSRLHGAGRMIGGWKKSLS